MCAICPYLLNAHITYMQLAMTLLSASDSLSCTQYTRIPPSSSHTHTSLLPAHTHLTVQNDTVPMRASLGQVILDVCNLAETSQEGGDTLLKHRDQRSRVKGQGSRWMQTILYRYCTCGPLPGDNHRHASMGQCSPQEEVQRTMTPPPPQGPQVWMP